MSRSNKEKKGYDPLHDGPELDQFLPAQPEEKKPPKPLQSHTDFLGLRQPFFRILAAAATLILLVVVLFTIRSFFGNKTAAPAAKNALAVAQIGITPTVTLNVPAPDLPNVEEVAFAGGIPRLALIHTNIPERPRDQMITYAVVEGDTVFGIAEKFGLKPETILWGNYYTLLDNPTFISPGMELNILPQDGILHKWSAGEGLNGVSSYYHVTPEDIINYPSNHLVADEVGDLSNPNIKPGTWLIVPGGTREYVTWSAPRITRDNPGVAKVLGSGNCGVVTDGPVGIEVFAWPTNSHFLSGYDYSPQTNHYGIDLDGETGDPIYATDNGVVVYAGWNDWGYGNMVVIDHGNGWQSLYAHLDAVMVDCGAWVYQGHTVGLMGSTGRSSGSHLHFELMNDAHGKVNPMSFLQ